MAKVVRSTDWIDEIWGEVTTYYPLAERAEASNLKTAFKLKFSNVLWNEDEKADITKVYNQSAKRMNQLKNEEQQRKTGLGEVHYQTELLCVHVGVMLATDFEEQLFKQRIEHRASGGWIQELYNKFAATRLNANLEQAEHSLERALRQFDEMTFWSFHIESELIDKRQRQRQQLATTEHFLLYTLELDEASKKEYEGQIVSHQFTIEYLTQLPVMFCRKIGVAPAPERRLSNPSYVNPPAAIPATAASAQVGEITGITGLTDVTDVAGFYFYVGLPEGMTKETAYIELAEKHGFKSGEYFKKRYLLMVKAANRRAPTQTALNRLIRIRLALIDTGENTEVIDKEIALVKAIL